MFDVVFELARHQHGAAAVWQVQPRGVGRSWLTRQCRRGVLYRRAPQVYVVAGAPATRRQELVVQVLSAGPAARATADSALAMWCSELDFPAQPEVTVPPTCGVRSGAMALRRSADMHLAKPTVLDGIPVVGMARALLDAAADHSVSEVVGRVDACMRNSSLAVGALIETLDRHRRSGRPGITVFQQAIQQLRRRDAPSWESWGRVSVMWRCMGAAGRHGNRGSPSRPARGPWSPGGSVASAA